MALGRSSRRCGDNINHGNEALLLEAFDGWYLKVEGLKFKIENTDFVDYLIGSGVFWVVESFSEREG
jgi:hypothetical protein